MISSPKCPSHPTTSTTRTAHFLALLRGTVSIKLNGTQRKDWAKKNGVRERLSVLSNHPCDGPFFFCLSIALSRSVLLLFASPLQVHKLDLLSESKLSKFRCVALALQQPTFQQHLALFTSTKKWRLTMWRAYPSLLCSQEPGSDYYAQRTTNFGRFSQGKYGWAWRAPYFSIWWPSSAVNGFRRMSALALPHSAVFQFLSAILLRF